MNLTQSIKEAFVFPSENLKQLAIYICFSIVVSIVGIGSLFSMIGSVYSGAIGVVGIILLIIGIIAGLIPLGYQISLVKSGIDGDEYAPEFSLKENLIVGIKDLIVKIVYFIIPALITAVIGILSGVPQNLTKVVTSSVESSTTSSLSTNMTTVSSTTVPPQLAGQLMGSLSLTVIIGLVVFIIFDILAMIADARLANTDSLGSALNIVETFKDIGKIGYGNVIATVVLVCLIILIIQAVLTGLSVVIPFIGILSIIVTPYLLFFAKRVIGVLYSEIA